MLIGSRGVASFDRSYDYRSFSSFELEVFDYYQKIDSEYYSDVLVYSTGFKGEVRYQLSDRAILASFGSLSRSEFLKDNRVKIKHSFSDQLQFKFQYLEQKDYDSLQSHSVFEFSYFPISKISLSLFAELGFEKANDNLGISTSYFFKPNHELKLFLNMIQYDRNKRNTKNDKFSKDPRAFGYIGKYTNHRYDQTEYFEYGLLIETPTRWQMPDDDLEFYYKRWMGTVRYLRPLSRTDNIFLLYQADKRTEQRETLSTGVAADPFLVRRHQLQIEYGTTKLKHFDWEVGAYAIERQTDVVGSKVSTLDVLSYTTIHLNRNELALGYWSFGYDIDFHDKEIRHATLTTRREAEHRANIYWTANLNEKTYLKFAFTADTDDFSWEGGNGKFLMEF